MNASELRCGESHEFAKTWARAGGELTDISTMTQSVKKCRQVIAYLRGEAEIVVKTVEKAAEVVIEKTIRLLREVGKVMLPATTEKETSQSFIDKRYYYRAPELDSWLAKVQPAGKEGQFTVHQLEKQMTFREIAAAILGLDETSDLDLLAKALIENGHAVVLSQIESIIERIDVGEDTGLRTDGWGNFFFVVNEDGSVSVVLVYRDDGGPWDVGVDRFDDDYRWDVGRRFFSRN